MYSEVFDNCAFKQSLNFASLLILCPDGSEEKEKPNGHLHEEKHKIIKH